MSEEELRRRYLEVLLGMAEPVTVHATPQKSAGMYVIGMYPRAARSAAPPPHTRSGAPTSSLASAGATP